MTTVLPQIADLTSQPCVRRPLPLLPIHSGFLQGPGPTSGWGTWPDRQGGQGGCWEQPWPSRLRFPQPSHGTPTPGPGQVGTSHCHNTLSTAPAGQGTQGPLGVTLGSWVARPGWASPNGALGRADLTGLAWAGTAVCLQLISDEAGRTAVQAGDVGEQVGFSLHRAQTTQPRPGASLG